MKKGVLQHFFRSLARRLSEKRTFFTLFLAASTAWIIKDPFVSQLVNPQDKNTLLQLAIFVLAFICCVLIFSVCAWCGKKFSARVPHGKPLDTTLNIAPDKRLATILVILVGGIIAILLVNQVLPKIDIHNHTFITPKIIPNMDPVGNDFRTGLYKPPHMLLAGEQIYYLNEDGSNLTQYPPLLNLLFMPYQLFSEDTAYLVHVILLFAANLACLALAARWAKDFLFPLTGFEARSQTLLAWLLFLVMAVFTLTGYPFLFSIERGNYDVLALFFAMLAVHSLIYHPNRVWLQVILLSIAVHLKIYPAALFILLLFKHGKKMILPALAVNVAFLLALGPANALTFLRIIRQNVATGFTWVGNHSGFSFATYLSWGYQSALGGVDWLRDLFTILPITLWVAAVFWAFKHKPFETKTYLLLFMATIPLMDVVPSISHDYKSVILGPFILLLLCWLGIKTYQNSNFWDYVQLFLVMLFILVLGRSFALNADQSLLLNHKYPVIMALFGVLLLNYKWFLNLPDEKH